MTTKGLVNGQKIEAARLAAGMSRTELARAAKTSERNLARWVSGQNQPRIESVAAIAEATGHDIDFFLTGTNEDEDESEAALTRDLMNVVERLVDRRMKRNESARAAGELMEVEV
jgi:transcriptional regulator with XRE-family HTH domain